MAVAEQEAETTDLSCDDVQPQQYLSEIVTFYNTNVVNGPYHYAASLIGDNKIINVVMGNEYYSIAIDDAGEMQSVQVGENSEATLLVTTDRCTVRDIIAGTLSLDEALDTDRIILDGTTFVEDVRTTLVEFVVDVVSWFN